MEEPKTLCEYCGKATKFVVQKTVVVWESLAECTRNCWNWASSLCKEKELSTENTEDTERNSEAKCSPRIYSGVSEANGSEEEKTMPEVETPLAEIVLKEEKPVSQAEIPTEVILKVEEPELEVETPPEKVPEAEKPEPKPEPLKLKKHTFKYRNPEAKDVKFAGDFNKWNPVSMLKNEKGIWRITVELEPGKYAYKLVVDGIWQWDSKNPQSQPDGKGDRNSIVVIT